MHQAEPQGVPHGRQQGDTGESPHRRVGNGAETDGRDGCKEPVEKDVRSDHSNPSLTINNVADRPMAMQMISIKKKDDCTHMQSSSIFFTVPVYPHI